MQFNFNGNAHQRPKILLISFIDDEYILLHDVKAFLKYKKNKIKYTSSPKNGFRLVADWLTPLRISLAEASQYLLFQHDPATLFGGGSRIFYIKIVEPSSTVRLMLH